MKVKSILLATGKTQEEFCRNLDFIKRLHELGFEGPYSGRKHPFMRKGDPVLTILNPHEGTIRVEL